MSLLPKIPGQMTASPERRTQSVLHIADLLSLDRAEFSRVLHCNCGDSTQFARASSRSGCLCRPDGPQPMSDPRGDIDTPQRPGAMRDV